MAAKILQINSFDYSGAVQQIVADCVADSSADLPTVNQFSGYTLQIGSTCICIADSSFYRLQSGGTWVQQLKDISADVYTRSQVDTLLAGKENTLTFDAAPTQNSINPVESGGVYTAIAQMNFLRVGVQIPANDDMDNYYTPGIYYVGSAANAATISNTPVSLAARVEIVPLWGTGRMLQRYITADSGVPIYYIRRYQNGVWTGWYKFEGVAV